MSITKRIDADWMAQLADQNYKLVIELAYAEFGPLSMRDLGMLSCGFAIGVRRAAQDILGKDQVH